SEIVANENKPAKGLIISHQPRGDAGEENQRRQSHAAQRPLTTLGTPVPGPQSSRRQKRKQGSAVQRDDAPKQPELKPRQPAVALLHREGQPEDYSHQQRRQ